MDSVTSKLVYVCHPYRDDPAANEDRVLGLCKALVRKGHVPVAPQVYLPRFIDEATQRKQAMQACLRLLRACDEVWVFGHDLSQGMQEEVALATEIGLPVLFAGKGVILGVKAGP